MDLLYTQLHISIPSADPAWCSFAVTGSAARFEAALLSLITGSPVDSDARRLLIDRPVSPDSEVARRHQKPSPPFRFSLVPNSHVLSLVILQPALPYLSLMLKAVAVSAGVPLSSLLVSAYSSSQLSYQLNPSAPSLENELPLDSLSEQLLLLEPSFVGATTVSLKTSSGIRMMHDGRELARLDPGLVLTASLRRLSSLCAYYGTPGDVDLIRSLALSADECRIVSSVGPYRMHGRRGLFGKYQLQVPNEALLPWLVLAGFFQIGKGASYGFGGFSIEPLA